MRFKMKTVFFAGLLICGLVFFRQMLLFQFYFKKKVRQEGKINDLNSCDDSQQLLDVEKLPKIIDNTDVTNKHKASSNCENKHQTVPSENHLLFYSPRQVFQESDIEQIQMCPLTSPLLKSSIDIDIASKPEMRDIQGKRFNWPMSFEEISSIYPNLLLGGFYLGPKTCQCRSFNAIIVPYRNRKEHLRYFLYYVHQLLQRQQLCYEIIVAEQADNKTFNKGDLIVHIAPFIDKYHYRFNESLTVGGVVGFTAAQFLSLNGFSNEFVGWGGEDDDMNKRIKMKEYQIWRSKKNYTRFIMIKHGLDKGNEVNPLRRVRLRKSNERMMIDGINTLRTKILDTILYRTHVRLKISTSEETKDYNSTTSHFATLHLIKEE